MSIKGSITTADYLPFEDYQRLVRSLIDDKRYWWACYCVLSFCTGLRFSDVCKLKWEDVLDKRKIVVTAKKTSKIHAIPIGDSAAEKLNSLYELMESPDKSRYILGGARNSTTPVSIQYINRYLKKFVHQYRLDIDNFSTHTFRKTFGRYVYESNGRTEQSLIYLNRIFKHSSLDTTMVYLGIRDKEISSIFNSIVF